MASNKTTREIHAGLTAIKINEKLKNNELNKNVTLLSMRKRQVKNKCDNIRRKETMTKYIDVLKIIKINDYIDFMVY